MRRPLAATLLFLLGAGAFADPVSFKRVWPEWEDGIDFQSYSEYRTGKEVVGKWSVLRSQPEHRSGLYFMTRVENHGPPVTGAAFVIRVISVGSVETRVYRFPADIPGKSWLFELGLTGRDWESSKLQPIAWEVELDDASGNILAKETSYLWEKPDKR